MSREDFNNVFWTLGIIWTLLAGASPLLLWALGMHMGFGGTKTYWKDHWFHGQDYWYSWHVQPKYNPTTPWPLIIGECFILVPGYALGAIAYKAADVLRKGARHE